jgi:hypothetical protein
MPLLIKRNHLGHAEIVRGSEVGFIFDKGLPVGTFSKAIPTKYISTVYQQRQKRLGGGKFWDRATDFTEATSEEAEKKAKEYIEKQKWQYVPYEK